MSYNEYSGGHYADPQRDFFVIDVTSGGPNREDQELYLSNENIIHLGAIARKHMTDRKQCVVFQAMIDEEEVGEDFRFPCYMTQGASGMDLYSNYKDEFVLKPGTQTLFNTFLRVSIPNNHELQIRSRSSMCFNHGVSILNSPGTIDSDYAGVIKIIFFNHLDKEAVIKPGERVAQLVLSKVEKPEFFIRSYVEDGKMRQMNRHDITAKRYKDIKRIIYHVSSSSSSGDCGDYDCGDVFAKFTGRVRTDHCMNATNIGGSTGK